MVSVSRQQRMFYYLLVGILMIHAGFMVVKVRDQISFTQPPEQVEAIKISLNPETIKAFAAAHRKQIVQSEDSASTEKPKDAAFLSDKDRNFDRQTIAKNVDKFKRAALGNGATTQVAQKSEQAKKKPAMKDIKLSDIGLASNDVVPQEVTRAPASDSKQGMQNGDALSQGFSATNDYVQETSLGDFTHLNTVEYKHYGFFHRIRQKLEQFWGNSIQEKSLALFKSGRRMPASQDLITSLQVTLNSKGEIIGVKILGASGVKELDDAAIESFNQAGPFPNPPKDLLVNGKATIEWGFVVKS